MRFKQFFCKHKDILVEDVVTEKIRACSSEKIDRGESYGNEII